MTSALNPDQITRVSSPDLTRDFDLRIEVEDSGERIAEGKRDLLFDSFTEVHQGRASSAAPDWAGDFEATGAGVAAFHENHLRDMLR